MCLYPRMIPNTKYTKTKKNGGNIPPVLDKRVLYVPIGCNKCMECRKKKAREWNVRLQEEVRNGGKALFVTMTFSNESIRALGTELHDSVRGYERDNAIATLGVRRFLERWRKKYKKSIRHWLVTELGQNGTENIHLHGIVWTEQPMEEVERIWSYGFMWKDFGKKNYVNGATVNYITKYVQKIDEKHRYYVPRILTSAGIGRGYNDRPKAIGNRYNGTKTDESYRTDKGHKLSLPIYYRNKIYSEEEREKLWLQRLDKGERWVCGIKIKATEDKKYIEALEHFRTVSSRLGYGDDKKQWSEEEYEKQRRDILYETRIRNAAPAVGGNSKDIG